MRRLLFTVLACLAVTVALPAGAMARHHARHHAHRMSHNARSHRARIRHFGAAASQSGSTAKSESGEPGDDNGQGDDQGGDNGQTAGTVTSFSGGMLTITLNDGTTVTGLVTGETNIECQAASTTQMHNDDQGDGGGDNSGSDDTGGSGGEDQGEDGDGNGASCTPAPGMTVREAELRVSSSGAIWKDLELIS
jgi:hypothetical protein